MKFVNQTIDEANKILGNKNKPFNNFDKFDDNDLPTNSDVTMMLGQYLNCMEKLRADNVVHNSYRNSWYWLIDNKESTIKTASPQKINNK